MKTKPGQSIIETVVAAGLISVALIAALSLGTRSESQTNYAKKLAEATKYATQAGDWLRTNRHQLGWATIASQAVADATSNVAIYCLDTLPNGASNFTSLLPGPCSETSYISGTNFIREISIDTTNVATGTLQIDIRLSWLDKTTRTSTIEMELNSW